MYNGANAALLGEEIIQFQTAILVGAGLYTLSNLLRGRRATEGATSSHAVGENFVLLYCDVKASEPDAYQQVISPWERQHLLLNV